jgi:hypothetical protein
MAASSAPSSRLNHQTLKETDLINASLQAKGAKSRANFLVLSSATNSPRQNPRNKLLNMKMIFQLSSNRSNLRTQMGLTKKHDDLAEQFLFLFSLKKRIAIDQTCIRLMNHVLRYQQSSGYHLYMERATSAINCNITIITSAQVWDLRRV